MNAKTWTIVAMLPFPAALAVLLFIAGRALKRRCGGCGGDKTAMREPTVADGEKRRCGRLRGAGGARACAETSFRARKFTMTE